MAAAGSRARATLSSIGDPISPRAACGFSISYRLATKTKTFPEAVQDMLAGVQFVRGKAATFGIDPARIGLIGASAGAHLAALAALSGKKFAGGYPQDAVRSDDTGVKALIGVYGIYDVVAMWTNYQVQGGRENNIQKFIGAPPMENRQLYFDASPISYATLPTTRSVFSSPPAPKTILSTARYRPTRFSSRSSKPAFLYGRASCPARRITG